MRAALRPCRYPYRQGRDLEKKMYFPQVHFLLDPLLQPGKLLRPGPEQERPEQERPEQERTHECSELPVRRLRPDNCGYYLALSPSPTPAAVVAWASVP